MKRTQRLKALLSLLSMLPLGALMIVPPLHAEFRCESTITFRIKTIPVPGPKSNGDKNSETAQPQEHEVNYALVDAIGADEAVARTALLKNLARERSRARDACQKRFETYSDCVASKFEANYTTLRTLDFAARKLLQESIQAECQHQQRVCGEPISSEPKCAEVVKAAAAESPAAATGGKDAKKKK